MYLLCVMLIVHCNSTLNTRRNQTNNGELNQTETTAPIGLSARSVWEERHNGAPCIARPTRLLLCTTGWARDSRQC